MKQCQKCKQEKPLAGFYKCNSSLDGLQKRCKDCQRVEARDRMRKPHNAAKQLERSRKWQAENYDKFNAYKTAWAKADYHANPEKWRASAAKYEAKSCATLADGYVRKALANSMGCNRNEVPAELVAAKRSHMAVKRLLQDKK